MSAHANLNHVTKIFKPPKGDIENVRVLIERWEDMVRCQGERPVRQALTIRNGPS